RLRMHDLAHEDPVGVAAPTEHTHHDVAVREHPDRSLLGIEHHHAAHASLFHPPGGIPDRLLRGGGARLPATAVLDGHAILLFHPLDPKAVPDGTLALRFA